MFAKFLMEVFYICGKDTLPLCVVFELFPFRNILFKGEIWDN
jgi:hypothetical protein